MSGLVPLLLLLQLANGPAIPAPTLASLEGVVVRAGTREPIDEAHVVLVNTAINEADPLRPPPSFAAVTDSQGRFSLKNMTPGDYRLTLSANGFARQEYGQRAFPGKGTLIHISEGQTTKELVAEMTPTGSIVGTIRDRDKHPLAGVPVQLMRETYDQAGDYRLRPSGLSVRTDDRGEFRIFFVTPGRYYLNAGTPSGPPGTGDSQPLRNEAPETYGYVYFPGVADLKLAMPIDIGAGETKTGADFTVEKVKGVRVSGRVIDATAGTVPENAKVKLAYRDPGVGWDYDLEYMGRGKVTYNKDGTFEFRDILPGLYAAVVTVDIPDQPKPQPGTTPLQRIAYVPIEVAGSNVNGIVLNAVAGTSINGRIRLEGRTEWTSAFPNSTGKYGVTLTPTQNGAQPAMPGVPQPNYGVLNSDGTFRIDNVMPGEFRVSIGQMRSSFYIKEARYGQTDILTRPFEFNGNATDELEIVMSPNVASLEGRVTSNGLVAVPGAQVVLVPDKGRHRAALFRNVTANQTGRFSIENVPPGDYKLYAWEAVELYRWFDPEFLRAMERYSIPVHLSDSTKQTIDAKMIPAASQ